MQRSGPQPEPPPVCCGMPCESRRASLRAIAGAAAWCAGVGGQGSARAADDGPRPGDLLVPADAPDAEPLRATDIKLGQKQRIVVPFDPAARQARTGSRLNRIVLLRLDPTGMDAATRARAADGVVAYSAICTHQGCDVSAWKANEQALLCFCHFSQFAPLQQGTVLAGPAPRPLPALPLKLDGERLAVAGGFSEAPGAANA